jgi:hypothetical protein
LAFKSGFFLKLSQKGPKAKILRIKTSPFSKLGRKTNTVEFEWRIFAAQGEGNPTKTSQNIHQTDYLNPCLTPHPTSLRLKKST